jgi:hypothetical protein
MSLNLITTYFVCYDVFFCLMSTFTRGGVYKVTPNDVEFSKTIAPWPGYEYNTLCCQWVGHFYLFQCLLVIPLLLI